MITPSWYRRDKRPMNIPFPHSLVIGDSTKSMGVYRFQSTQLGGNWIKVIQIQMPDLLYSLPVKCFLFYCVLFNKSPRNVFWNWKQCEPRIRSRYPRGALYKFIPSRYSREFESSVRKFLKNNQALESLTAFIAAWYDYFCICDFELLR